MSLKKEISLVLKSKKEYYGEVEKHYRGFNDNLEEVIINAGKAKVPWGCQGKNSDFAKHQWRVGEDLCAKGAKALLEYKDGIGRAKTFNELLEFTDKVKNRIDRIGPLWSYDTAQRIGFNKGIYPQKVYLQTGAKKGAWLLAKHEMVDRKLLWGKRYVDPEIFPKALRELEPYFIENMLCVGKRKGWLKKKNIWVFELKGIFTE